MAGKIGKPLSEEHKKHLSDSVKEWWRLNKNNPEIEIRNGHIREAINGWWKKNEYRKDEYGVRCKKQFIGSTKLRTGNDFKCKECDKIFYAMKCRNNPSFCSYECYLINLRKNGSHLRKENKDHKTSHIVKQRILEEKDKCDICGFLDKRILEMHHKDNNGKNHSKANLLLLCPNCHAIIHYETKSGMYHNLKKEDLIQIGKRS